MRKIFLILVFLYCGLSSYTQYQDEVSKIMVKLKTVKDSVKVDLMNQLAGMYYFGGKLDSSKFLLHKAVNLSDKINYPRGVCKSYANLASLELYERNFSGAIVLYTKALEIAEKNNFKTQIASIFNNMAIVFYTEDKFEESNVYYFKSLKICDELSDTIGVIYNYSGIGNCYLSLGDGTKAYEFSKRAETLCLIVEQNSSLSTLKKQELKNVRTTIWINIAEIFLSQKNFISALSLSNKLLEENKHTTDTVQLMRILTDKAASHKGLKEYNQALQFANLADSYIKNNMAEHLDAYKDIYRIQSEAYSAKKDFENAYKATVLYKNASDSFNTKAKTKIINEIQIKYETEKKDQAIIQLNTEKQLQKIITGLALGASLVGLSLFALAYRSKRLQERLFKQKQELDKIALEKQMASLEQSALRAQMNPHFIFNSLTSIQNFVSDKEGQMAQKFISSFARLIRQTLDNSGKQLIPLEDEVKYLDSYLSLEQIRLKNKFTYKIIVQQNIDTEQTYIPGMILQPFVENSIKHGIANKQNNDGYIHITISKNGTLNCIIQDNGIGRSYARLLKTIGEDTYESKGMDITYSRIETFKKIYETQIDILTEDLINIQGEACGTKIKIDFPIDL
jgi:LytS/YehU family sensor histidine kinase